MTDLPFLLTNPRSVWRFSGERRFPAWPCGEPSLMCSRQSVQLHAPWQGRALVWPQAATWPMTCNRKCAGQLLGNCWSPFRREHGASPLLPWMMLGEDVSLGASTATLYPSGGSTDPPAEDRREEQKGGCAWVPPLPLTQDTAELPALPPGLLCVGYKNVGWKGGSPAGWVRVSPAHSRTHSTPASSVWGACSHFTDKETDSGREINLPRVH